MVNRLKHKKLIVSALAVTLAWPFTSAVSPVAAAQQEDALVPARTVAESLGAQVSWEPESRTVTIARDATDVVFALGDTEARVNEQVVPLDQAVTTIEDRAYVPLSLLNEAFDADIGWDSDSKQVVFGQDDYTGLASYLIYLLFNDGIGGLPSLLNESLQSSVTEAQWGEVAQVYPQYFGAIGKRLSASVEQNGVHTNAKLVYETSATPIEVTVRFDRDGLVDDLFFGVPSFIEYGQADYDKGNYEEHEVVLGSGTFALPGTLTVPDGDGPFPVAILVHGSGQNDRDETIGGIKVFKDIAVGLAAHGIASLRYDKVTLTHGFKVSAQPEFTIANETADDVRLAVELLKTYEQIDESRIYVIGHSQGGYMVPVMFEQDTDDSLAGAILLAGPSGRLMDVLIEQQQLALEHLKTLEMPEALIAQQEQAVAYYKAMLEIYDDPAYSLDNLPADFLTPVYYWFEQRDYVPAEMAAKQSKPMLILQGENDWQVTMKQFEGWKEALQVRTNVEYRSYPKVNHLLTEYDGLSVGLEYNDPAHVSAEIIEDMAAWILKQ